jgi:hypothetical protein
LRDDASTGRARSRSRPIAPAPLGAVGETATLLSRWRVALRAELEAVIVELGNAPALPPGVVRGQTGWIEPGELTSTPGRPALERRSALVALGDKIARALGEEVDEPPAPAAPPAERARRSRKVEY